MVSSISKKPFRFLQIFLKEIIIEFPLWFLRIFPTEIGVILRSICYSVLLKKQKKFLRIAENVTVKGFKNIELGERVTLNQFSYIHAVNGFLKVGDRFVGNFRKNHKGNLIIISFRIICKSRKGFLLIDETIS